MKMENILRDFRIINMGLNLPAPLAAQRLSQMGARVVKIEPVGSDPFESYSPNWYRDLHRGQEVMQLDLKSEAGKSVMGDLLKASDLLMTSMRPSALRRLELDWDSLHARYAEICLVSIIGYPAPEEEVPGHDLTYQARAGLVKPPTLPRLLLADVMGAERAVQASLGLLLERARNGKGGFAQVPLSSGVDDLGRILQYEMSSPDTLVTGGEACYNLYKTRSGWVALAALERDFWQALTNALDLDQDADKAALSEIFISRTAEEWELWAKDLGLPLCRVVE